MSWLAGLASRGTVLLGLAGTAAAVYAGVQAVQAVRADGDALASEISEVLVNERRHREALVRLMEAAEAGADAALEGVLAELKLALENRMDWTATVSDLVEASRAVREGASPADRAAAADRARLLWGSLAQKSLVHCAVGFQLAAVARAAVRVALAAAAAGRAKAMTRAQRAASTAGAAPGALAEPMTDPGAVSEALLAKLCRWLTREVTSRLCERAEGRARAAMLEEPATAGLVAVSPGDGGPFHARPVALPVLRRLILASGAGDSVAEVLRGALPPASASLASLRLPAATPSDLEASAGGPSDGLAEASAVPAAAEAAAERACLVALDVLDSPVGAEALRPSLEGGRRRALEAAAAVLEAAAVRETAPEEAGPAAAEATAAPIGMLARKLGSGVSVVSDSAPPGSGEDAMVRAAARRAFAELSGCHEAAAECRPAGRGAAGAHADAVSALVADLVGGRGEQRRGAGDGGGGQRGGE